MDRSLAIVGKRAPEFDLACTMGSSSSRRRTTSADYRDRWLALVFYPRDFSLVCPTELTALSTRIAEFRQRGCDVLAISTDTIESHERWIRSPRAQGGLGGIQFPLASDEDGAVSRSYGVLLEPQRIALRGLFIIDPNGVLQYQAIHNLSVGRRSEEVLRVLAALESGGMCPEDWSAASPTLDPTKALMPGSMLSHFRIDAEVGRGSFASVYRAYDTVLHRSVAVKVFRPDATSTPREILAEARAAAALNHPNVCAIFAVDNSEGVPFIAMEYVDGRPLSAVVKSGPMSPADVARVGRQVALGMAAAHKSGVVHGDLKPPNILLTSEGTAKVTDFGLSRHSAVRGDIDETLDWVAGDLGTIAGTPGYMSPEQSRGEPAVPASDVFSFGTVVYEMLTGRKAFSGRSILEVLNQISNVEPERHAAEVPEPFDDIVRRSLVRQPEERVLTMEEISQLIGSCL